MIVKNMWEVDPIDGIPTKVLCSLTGSDYSKLKIYSMDSEITARRNLINSYKFGQALCFNMSYWMDIRSDVETRVDFQLFYYGEDINPEQISNTWDKESGMWCLVHNKDDNLHASHKFGSYKGSLCWRVLIDDIDLYNARENAQPTLNFHVLMHKHQQDEQYGWPYIYAVQWSKAINENISDFREYLSDHAISGPFNNYLFANVVVGEDYLEPRFRT